MDRFERSSQRTESRFKTADGAGEKASSVAQSVPLHGVEKRVLDLNAINDEKNQIKRSSAGKTSGVFLVTNPIVGEVTAALKPVNDKEILANKLFEVLGMPIPKFDIWNKGQIRDSIRCSIDKSFQGQVIVKSYEKIMVMEAIMGRPLSECDPAAIKTFLSNKDNLHSLGRSMAFDLLIGNADRIMFFTVPVVNPDNIMVKDNHAVFIDQVFNAQDANRWKTFYDKLMRSIDAPLDDKTCIYNRHISPLVEKSLKKYSAQDLSSQDLIAEFKQSINDETKRAINSGLSEGIQSAMKDLSAKKDEVLNLSEHSPETREYFAAIYAQLEA